MRTRFDQYLRDYGIDLAMPQRRTGISPRQPKRPMRFRRLLPRFVVRKWGR